MSERSSSSEAPFGSWGYLCVLALVYACHHLDRTILFALAEPIREEFDLTDGQLGAVSGLAYGLAFGVAALPIGFFVDRTDRRRLLGVMAIVWSGLTALTGAANSYVTLWIARFGVGLAEAGGAPASLSLLTDLFGPKRRSIAVGVLYSSLAIGGLGTAVITALVATEYGWRSAFLVAGIPGVILGVILLFFLKEPLRGAMEPEQSDVDPQVRPKIGETLTHIFSNAVYLNVLMAVTLSVTATACVGVWFTSFLIRYQGMDLVQAASLLGLAYGLFAAIGSLLGGLAGEWAGRERPHRRLIAPMLCLLVAAPVLAIGLTINHTIVAVSLLVAAPALFQGALAPSFATALSVTPPAMRGTAAALLQLSTNLLGVGVGPALVGLASDAIGLREALVIAAVIACLWSALHFGIASRLQAAASPADQPPSDVSKGQRA